MIARRAIRGAELSGDTLDRVLRITQDHLGVPPEAVFPEASFVEDLDADSLDKAELMIAFEEAFQVEIPQAEAEHIATVENVVDFIEMRMRERPSPNPETRS
jgi:acyl carrier protein